MRTNFSWAFPALLTLVAFAPEAFGRSPKEATDPVTGLVSQSCTAAFTWPASGVYSRDAVSFQRTGDNVAMVVRHATLGKHDETLAMTDPLAVRFLDGTTMELPAASDIVPMFIVGTTQVITSWMTSYPLSSAQLATFSSTPVSGWRFRAGTTEVTLDLKGPSKKIMGTAACLGG